MNSCRWEMPSCRPRTDIADLKSAVSSDTRTPPQARVSSSPPRYRSALGLARLKRTDRRRDAGYSAPCPIATGHQALSLYLAA